MAHKQKRAGVLDFIREYKIISFAIAIIIGQAMADFIQSIVNNLIMPLLDPLINEGTWKTATIILGPFSLGWGVILSSFLNLTLLIIIIYIIIEKIAHYKPLTKK